jgi:vacuolar protein sorting-associated protein 13A/C
LFCKIHHHCNVISGAVEGPSEFAEGLAIGVRSVFSGVVGGAAGTVSKITGALGKGLASLTFDEKFQQKRREQGRDLPKSWLEFGRISLPVSTTHLFRG